MAVKRLPPGFRFHPTDVELVMYYLKRKITGKKLHYEAIADVNIYKFSPWDLPDKSCLKSKDLEWFFFCPRERKYASGSRVKRATENGYWKTTGKDRFIHYNNQNVGTVKTLVFHLGHAPRGERTDWVIYEYKIIDADLAAAGMQDSYVLCKVFKKDGMGPKNGAQYGAPFNEADWADDVDAENHSIPLTSDCPPLTMPIQTEEDTIVRGLILSPGDTSVSCFAGQDPSPSGGGTIDEVVAGETDDNDIVRLLASCTDEDMLLSNDNGLILSTGDTSGSCFAAQDPSPSGGGTIGEFVAGETDENDIVCMLDSFTDEDMLLSNDNGITQDGLIGNIGNELLPCSDGPDIYNGLGDLDSRGLTNEGVLDFSLLQNDVYYLENMPFQDNSAFIELDDLLPPLDCSNGVATTDQLSNNKISGTPSCENIQQLYSGASFSGTGWYAPCSNELPAPLKGSYQGDCLDLFQMVNHQMYQGSSNASSGLHITYGQSKNLGHPTNGMERGSEKLDCYSRLMGCNPPAHQIPTAAEHLALTSPRSSIHIKAEVTHGAGECTNEALLVMMGGSGSCWCYSQDFQKLLVEFCFDLNCFLSETITPSCYYNHHLDEVSIIIFSSKTIIVNLIASFLNIVRLQTFSKFTLFNYLVKSLS